MAAVAGSVSYCYEISTNIYVGNQISAGLFPLHEHEHEHEHDRERVRKDLHARRTTVIICCCASAGDTSCRVYAEDGIAYVSALLPEDEEFFHAPACDSSVSLFISLIEQAYPLVVRALCRNESVLVHCTDSLRRSFSVAVGLIMALREERGQEGLTAVCNVVVVPKTVDAKGQRPGNDNRPLFWRVLESDTFTLACRRLRNTTMQQLVLENLDLRENQKQSIIISNGKQYGSMGFPRTPQHPHPRSNSVPTMSARDESCVILLGSGSSSSAPNFRYDNSHSTALHEK